MSVALAPSHDAGPPALPGSALAPADADGAPGLHCRWLGRIGFTAALALQESLVRTHHRHGDLLLLLEHDPVYTTGRGGRVEHQLGLAEGDLGSAREVVRIGRGGDVTYHGPGQLVGYALVDLRARGFDLHRFLRDLEAGVIATLDALGVRAARWPGRTGVWVADGGDAAACDDADMQRGRIRKIASIGIGVRRGITMHGFALNVDLDLEPFAAIVPCGLGGVQMTSVAREMVGTPPPLATVAALAAQHVGAALTCPQDRPARRTRGGR
jgi:lipoate-protein ligase B